MDAVTLNRSTTTLVITDKERARFEAWAAKKLEPAGREHPWFERNSQGEYVFGSMPQWWEAWVGCLQSVGAEVLAEIVSVASGKGTSQ